MKPIRLRFAQPKTPSRFREWRHARRPRMLFTKSEVSPERTLAIRLGLIVLLISVVLLVFWFDRAGLKDVADGEVTWSTS